MNYKDLYEIQRFIWITKIYMIYIIFYMYIYDYKDLYDFQIFHMYIYDYKDLYDIYNILYELQRFIWYT